MSQPGQPAQDRITATANRLRLLQVELADQPEQARLGYLNEVITQALAGVHPSERPAFVEELKSRFPTWDGQVKVEDSAPRGTLDEAEARKIDFLLPRFIDAVGRCDEAQKAALVRHLRDAGLDFGSGAAWSSETERDLRAKLPIHADQPIDPTRLAQLVTLLLDFTLMMERVWNIWRAIAPQSPVRKPAPLQAHFTKFLAGDPEVSRAVIGPDLDRLRELIASLTTSITAGSERFAAGFLKMLSPAEVEQAVRDEGGGRFGIEKKYWAKYVEVFGAAGDQGSIAAAIGEAIAQYAESLMRGVNQAHKPT